MKYIAFWEFKPEDIDKVIELTKQLEENRAKSPEKYAKRLFPPHAMSVETNGFTVVEGTSEQIMNTTLPFLGVLNVEYVPIFASAKITEQYLKSK